MAVLGAHPGDVGDGHAELAPAALQQLGEGHVHRSCALREQLAEELQQPLARMEAELAPEVQRAAEAPEAGVLEQLHEIRVVEQLAQVVARGAAGHHRGEEAAAGGAGDPQDVVRVEPGVLEHPQGTEVGHALGPASLEGQVLEGDPRMRTCGRARRDGDLVQWGERRRTHRVEIDTAEVRRQSMRAHDPTLD